jgi:hypothetical protein
LGFELRGEGGSVLDFGVDGWEFYIRLARAYGWEPLGSLPPPGVAAQDWEGSYDSNDGQVVSREDANAFAVALERALEDPQRRRTEQAVCAEMNRVLREEAWRVYQMRLGPEEDVCLEADEASVRQLVDLGRKGSFRIL